LLIGCRAAGLSPLILHESPYVTYTGWEPPLAEVVLQLHHKMCSALAVMHSMVLDTTCSKGIPVLEVCGEKFHQLLEQEHASWQCSGQQS
jgi:hypothetical protein